MIKLRPSFLKNVIANPYNYFKIEKDISNLSAVKNGLDREAISYLLYDQYTKNTNYQKQVKGSFKINDNAVLMGTCDILTSDSIIDIKNSKLDDTKLIAEYQYQLSAYCLIFNKTHAYLFVDSNKNSETNINMVRLIEVPLIPFDVLKSQLVSCVNTIKELDNLNFNLIMINKNELMDEQLNKYFELKNKIKELEKEVKEVETSLLNSDVYENELYSVHYEATKKVKRIVKNEWTNEYENKLVITKK